MGSMPPNAIQLGRIGPPTPAESPDLRNQLFHLRRPDAIVAPHMRQAGGWRCVVVAVRYPQFERPRHAVVSDDELASAPRALNLDEGADPDVFAMLWVTRAHQRYPSGSLTYVAERLAEDLRKPGSRAIDLGRTSFEWLRHHANRIVANTLELNLARLVRDGLLIPDPLELSRRGVGTYLIALPRSGPELSDRW